MPGERLKNEKEERELRADAGGREDEKIMRRRRNEEPLCLYLLGSRHLARNTDRKSPRCPSPKPRGWPGGGGCAGGRPVWARGVAGAPLRIAKRSDAATAVVVAVAAAIDDDIWNR